MTNYPTDITTHEINDTDRCEDCGREIPAGRLLCRECLLDIRAERLVDDREEREWTN